MIELPERWFIRKWVIFYMSKNFYDIKPLLSIKAQWNIVMGGRNGGKSFQIKELAIKEAMRGELFLYLRRYQDDMDISSVLEYFSDVIKNRDGKNYLEIWTGGKYNSMKAGQRKIWFNKIDEIGEEDKDVKPFLCGYYGAISKSQSFKSREKPDVRNIIFEEFIPESTPLLPKEPAKLESIVSSVARDDFVRVFCIGNNVDRDFYYFRYWNLNKIKKQKAGTIDMYEFENGDFDEDGNPVKIKFAVEIVPDFPGRKGMFFGRGAKINSSEWQTSAQPYMHQDDLEGYENIYQVFFEFHSLKWRARLYIKNETGEMFWYVEPFTGEIKSNERVVSDIVSTNPFHSINIEPFNKFEKIGFDAMRNGKVFFSDSLCGTEFKRAFAVFMVSDLSTAMNEL